MCFTKHTSTTLINEVYILRELDSCLGKYIKTFAGVPINLKYSTHKELQFSKPSKSSSPGIQTICFINQRFSKVIQETIMNDREQQNVQNVPAIYVSFLLGLCYHFHYNYSNESASC